jgi:regulator of protease activity HflC (stomatin/prohibitin superfamily)
MFLGIWRFIHRNKVTVIVSGLLIGILALYFAPSIFISIRAGEAGVLYRRFFGGTVRNHVYAEGMHAIWPWDTMAVYTVRVQQVLRELDVLDRNGLQFKLHVAIRYYPEYDVLPLLHQKVGPDYAEKIVVPEVESVLRTTSGNFAAEELYTTQHSVLARIANEALDQANENFVIIQDVIIRSIELPPPIKQAIEKKQEEQQLAAAYVYKIERETKEAQRKLIEANGTREANDVVTESLNPDIMKWAAIQATLSISTSQNAKVIVIGNSGDSLPVILGSDK